VKSYCI